MGDPENQKMEVQHRHISAMGTRLDLVFPGMEFHRCEELTGQIQAELQRLDSLLSIYRSDSEISLLNRTAYAGTVEVSQELYDILSRVKRYSAETGGYFDVTMKPVSDFLQKRTGQEQQLDQITRDCSGIDKLILEKEGVRFKQRGMVLDLGGFGKGYALERIGRILELAGVRCALINFGESLIFGLGSHPFGESWSINISGESSKVPLIIDLKDEALSTSGNSLNNQKKFANSGHIVNPVTLRMTTSLGLVSVKAKDPVLAEVYSTALFSAGPVLSDEILKDLPEVKYHWITPTR